MLKFTGFLGFFRNWFCRIFFDILGDVKTLKLFNFKTSKETPTLNPPPALTPVSLFARDEIYLDWTAVLCLIIFFMLAYCTWESLFYGFCLLPTEKWKVLLISSKKLFLFSRYSNFCNFSPFFPLFPRTKGQMKVE